MTGDRDLEEESATHRTGETDANGKREVRLEFLATEEVREHVRAVATIKNMSMGEYMRRCIERDLYGEVELMRRSVERNSR